MNQQQTAIALPTVFDDFNAQLVQLESDNSSVVFDYKNKKENKAARSHVATLRKSKTAIGVIHKEAKAEALAECQRIDAGKTTLINRVEAMIEIHTIPLKAIEAEEAAAQLKAEMEEQRIAEAKALAIKIEHDHEAAILEDERRAFEKDKAHEEMKRQAQIKADSEAANRIAQAKAAEIAAEQKVIQAEINEKQALINQEAAKKTI